ncbi:unnamed protein product [Symbiodinium sp. CCMP2456]|nr:unnamed protein product [Symbiodinium sp. CCMP2456]
MQGASSLSVASCMPGACMRRPMRARAQSVLHLRQRGLRPMGDGGFSLGFTDIHGS